MQIFLPSFCHWHSVVRKKWNPKFIFFFPSAYVVFAQILIKIMHVYIIHILYAYMKVTRPRVHYRVITLWESSSSCCRYELYAEVSDIYFNNI
jgi:hypothetical protein